MYLQDNSTRTSIYVNSESAATKSKKSCSSSLFFQIAGFSLPAMSSSSPHSTLSPLFPSRSLHLLGGDGLLALLDAATNLLTAGLSVFSVLGLEGAYPLFGGFLLSPVKRVRPRRADTDADRCRALHTRRGLGCGNGHDGMSVRRGRVRDVLEERVLER